MPVRCIKAEAINLSMCQRRKSRELKCAPCSAKVYFQAGGKYWKNADWYLGKHLAGMGVKVAINSIHKYRQIIQINSQIQVKDTRDHLGRGRFNGYSFR